MEGDIAPSIAGAPDIEGAPDMEDIEGAESRPGMVDPDIEEAPAFEGEGSNPGIEPPPDGMLPPIPPKDEPESRPESNLRAGESVPTLSAPAFSLLWEASRNLSVSRFSFSMSARASATCSIGS